MRRATQSKTHAFAVTAAVAILTVACRSEPPPPEPVDLARNLFGGLLGKNDVEVRDKLDLAVRRFFGLGTGEPNRLVATKGYRCYYELPQDPNFAFVWAADSNDIRSEGMSYGMMIAVQAGFRDQFDRLWNFSKRYLQYAEDSEVKAWRNYFKWRGRVDARDPLSWAISYGPTEDIAPDGDEYIAAALYLANRRWGSDGQHDYLGEANRIASAMLHNEATEARGADDVDRHPIIHETRRLVSFAPVASARDFTNPSYQLPAFYELFARDGPLEDGRAWREIAEASRQFLVRAAHRQTGLHPDYASFDGDPVAGPDGQRHDQFRHDAWRVIMNMAVDYDWFSRDGRLRLQIEKYHEFFSHRVANDNVRNHSFALDGSEASGGGSTALTATLASGSVASQRSDRARFVSNLWKVRQEQGRYRYYQEAVYLLGLFVVAGEFNDVWGAETKTVRQATQP